MTKSMTAFASSEAEIGALTINCELRSVNHRYLDISIKLPERLRFTEADIRSAVAAKISRGKIECTLTCKKLTKDSPSLFVNREAVAALLAAAQQIEAQMTGPLSFSALDVLAFPGIQQEPELDKETLNRGIAELVGQTLLKLLDVREREGRQLQSLIRDRCKKMQLHAAAARKRIPEVLQAIRNKLKDRIAELAVQPDFDRLEQELVFLTQKLDIDEELDRLETHITEVLRVIEQNEPVGRRLDFLMQEMNREANTLGSKSADKEITKISIELKVLIEQIREQIQNIE
ncbi:YicC/YloC family endoribonuclease [Candidatus Methylomicrobium oryzae]|uniref:YicC/YloC family endoribonuclease n=1 Tax=Candidatus Methylomicrobium oryzae TaxID=2802053 RepID=UPI0019229426|nr:YicC/YloC family endoribonuclease [Methylomicrobium sp. RS1]MBL1265943.1 YicC family protein [Methylomicrobium sp. RS1]